MNQRILPPIPSTSLWSLEGSDDNFVHGDGTEMGGHPQARPQARPWRCSNRFTRPATAIFRSPVRRLSRGHFPPAAAAPEATRPMGRQLPDLNLPSVESERMRERRPFGHPPAAAAPDATWPTGSQVAYLNHVLSMEYEKMRERRLLGHPPAAAPAPATGWAAAVQTTALAAAQRLPMSSRPLAAGASPGPSLAAAGPAAPAALALADAEHIALADAERIVEYWALVRSTLNDDEFQRFRTTLMAFKRNEMNALRVAYEVNSLFFRHPRLIPGFNKCLPKWVQIRLSIVDVGRSYIDLLPYSAAQAGVVLPFGNP